MTFAVATSLGEVSVRVRQSSDPSGGAVLLLHANPGDSRDFDAIVDVLAGQWIVVSLDWPGYGGSTVTDPDRVTGDGLVGVAEEVLDAIAARGIERVSVIGNSVGGYVAARLAQRRPAAIASVVLVDPAGFTPRNALTRTLCRQVMGRPRVAAPLIAPLARAYLGPLRTASSRATYARARQLRRDPRRLAVHCALWRGFADPAFDLTAASLVTPALLVWGRRDPVVPAAIDGRRARRALPHASTAWLSSGHEAFNERPREFLDHVVPFLLRHTSSGSGGGHATG